ncbi:hypothetical protein [Streptomyces sp. NPDC004788]
MLLHRSGLLDALDALDALFETVWRTAHPLTLSDTADESEAPVGIDP